jgi:predicted Zn-dependent protease
MVGGIGGLLGQNVKGNNPLVQNLIGNGAEIVARGLDKDSEFEADRIGMVLSARAGYDAYGLPSVLQAIGHVALNDNRMALLYKTHPHPDVRLTRLGESVTDHFDRLEAGKTLDNRFYRLR